VAQDDWFDTRLVASATWAISDRGCDVIYLAAGEERALMIDTGWGIGDLPALVAGLAGRGYRPDPGRHAGRTARKDSYRRRPALRVWLDWRHLSL
jgi:hypothetical protein